MLSLEEKRLLKSLGKNNVMIGDDLVLTFGKVVWTPNYHKDEKCRECGRRFSINEIVWCYFTSNDGVIGYICVNCFEKGVHLSLKKTIRTNYEIDW
jgi:hypothetical protein